MGDPEVGNLTPTQVLEKTQELKEQKCKDCVKNPVNSEEDKKKKRMKKVAVSKKQMHKKQAKVVPHKQAKPIAKKNVQAKQTIRMKKATKKATKKVAKKATKKATKNMTKKVAKKVAKKITKQDTRMKKYVKKASANQ